MVVLLHGGFWRARYGKWIMQGLCDDLVRRGYAAWNLEYRRVGWLAGGGYPTTLEDVAAGVDHLAAIADRGLDLTRVAIVGHSAGGHLALWLAGREQPAIDATAYIALAGVADLRLAHELGLGDGIVGSFMGGPPEERADAYRAASPIERLPTPGQTRQVLIHGTADTNVPLEVGRAYYEAARDAGEDVEWIERECDHMVLIDPRSAEWQLVVDRLP